LSGIFLDLFIPIPPKISGRMKTPSPMLYITPAPPLVFKKGAGPWGEGVAYPT